MRTVRSVCLSCRQLSPLWWHRCDRLTVASIHIQRGRLEVVEFDQMLLISKRGLPYPSLRSVNWITLLPERNAAQAFIRARRFSSFWPR